MITFSSVNPINLLDSELIVYEVTIATGEVLRYTSTKADFYRLSNLLSLIDTVQFVHKNKP